MGTLVARSALAATLDSLVTLAASTSTMGPVVTSAAPAAAASTLDSRAVSTSTTAATVLG
jgi:hypothetical protein